METHDTWLQNRINDQRSHDEIAAARAAGRDVSRAIEGAARDRAELDLALNEEDERRHQEKVALDLAILRKQEQIVQEQRFQAQQLLEEQRAIEARAEAKEQQKLRDQHEALAARRAILQTADVWKVLKATDLTNQKGSVALLDRMVDNLEVPARILSVCDIISAALPEFARQSPADMHSVLRSELRAEYRKLAKVEIEQKAADYLRRAEEQLSVASATEPFAQTLQRRALCNSLSFSSYKDPYHEHWFAREEEAVAKMEERLYASFTPDQKDLLSLHLEVPERVKALQPNEARKDLLQRALGDIPQIFRCRLHATRSQPRPVPQDPEVVRTTDPVSVEERSDRSNSGRIAASILLSIGAALSLYPLGLDHFLAPLQVSPVIGQTVAGVAGLGVCLLLSILERVVRTDSPAKLRRKASALREELTQSAVAKNASVREQAKAWVASGARERAALFEAYSAAFPDFANELQSGRDEFAEGGGAIDPKCAERFIRQEQAFPAQIALVNRLLDHHRLAPSPQFACSVPLQPAQESSDCRFEVERQKIVIVRGYSRPMSWLLALIGVGATAFSIISYTRSALANAQTRIHERQSGEASVQTGDYAAAARHFAIAFGSDPLRATRA